MEILTEVFTYLLYVIMGLGIPACFVSLLTHLFKK